MKQENSEIEKKYLHTDWTKNVLLVREPKKSNLILAYHATAKTKKVSFSQTQTDFV